MLPLTSMTAIGSVSKYLRSESSPTLAIAAMSYRLMRPSVIKYSDSFGFSKRRFFPLWNHSSNVLKGVGLP